MLKADTLIVRTPFFPFIKNGVREEFERQLQSAVFKEALFLGSPNLYEEFAKAGPFLNEATRLSLYKYFLRMSYRCTPFGMFSGVSSGVVGEQTSFKLSSQHTYIKHTRPDNHFINVFIHKVLSDEAIKKTTSWFSNNTAYQSGNSIRYVEYRLANNQRTHHLAKVESSIYLNAILTSAKHGATIHELTSTLVALEISEDEATAFIDELIDSRLLLSELEPVVTGQEPYLRVLAILEKYERGKPYTTFLKKIIEQINYIDTQPPGTEIDRYQEVLKLVKEWDNAYDPKLIFQSDLCKPVVEMQVSTCVLDEIQNAISFLAILNGAPVHSNLNKFKEEFSKRYEDAEISLLEVLDTEAGIGYPAGAHANNDQSPLLNGLYFQTKLPVAEYKVMLWQKVLMNEYQQCIAQGKIELEVTDALFSVDNKIFDSSRLADSLYTICSLLGTKEELQSDNFSIDYRGSSGPSAANLLGRFCYLDSDVESITKQLIQQEEKIHPDKIFAEVVHLAQARVGNVLIRPSFRKYEIPILTFAGVDEEHTIVLSDILVTIQSNKIVLRSKKLGKEIVPRNTTAHNYSSDTVPYYYFLCDLQQQESNARLSWDWSLLNEFKFLPRVKYGRVILSKARWVIDEKDVSVITKQIELDFKNELDKYRKNNQLPQWVVLSQGDNQLPLDLEDDLCLNILRQELIRNKRVVLEESLFNENNLVMEGPEGRFTNEIIIPWSKIQKKADSKTRTYRATPLEQRNFIPGSSWQYVKIYCGVKTSDQILVDVIKPLADELLSENIISQWFFIRYADPDYHLRVRFKSDKLFFAEITERLNKRLEFYLSHNLVSKIQHDTYKRELERYGRENIENSELLFFHDSVAAVEILKLLDGDDGDELRWMFTLKGVNDLLTDFGYSLEGKEKVMIPIRDGFMKEFNATDKESQKQLSEHLRRHKKEIEFLVSPEIEDEHDYHEVWKIFETRSREWAACVHAAKELANSSSSNLSLDDLVGSYVHMLVNRFIRSKQRVHELVIYDFLCQHYHSAIARQRKDKLVSVQKI